jgi:hypothetical protein
MWDNESAHLLFLDWNSEQLRRNVSNSLLTMTRNLATNVTPQGLIHIGSSQLVESHRFRTGEQQVGQSGRVYWESDPRLNARVYAGSNTTLHSLINLGGSSYDQDFQRGLQRWQFTIGLPSSAFFVSANRPDRTLVPTLPERMAYRDRALSGEGVVLVCAHFYAISTNQAGTNITDQLSNPIYIWEPGGDHFVPALRLPRIPFEGFSILSRDSDDSNMREFHDILNFGPDSPSVIAIFDAFYTSDDDLDIFKSH